MTRLRVVARLACLMLLAAACAGADDTASVTPTAEGVEPAATEESATTDAEPTVEATAEPVTTTEPAATEPADTELAAEDTPEAATEPVAAAGDVDGFCDSLVQAEMTAARGPDVDFESASSEEIEEAVGSFAEELTPMLDAMMAEVPDAVADQTATLDQLLRQAVETGDPSIFEQDEFRQADRAVDEFVVDNCDYPFLEVQAVDYAFEGVPETVEPGIVAIDFSNGGAEVHEMALMRLNDDTTETVEELLQLPEEEALPKVTPAGHAFAFPETGDITFVDLQPGEYFVACFIPVGTTPDKIEELESGGEPGGPPHFTAGMVAKFSVTG